MSYYKDFLIRPCSAAHLTVSFIPQDDPLGIAQAIGLCEKYVDDESQNCDSYYTLLGDNVFVGEVAPLARHYKKPWILASKVAHPNQYGVLDVDLWRVTEKPVKPVGDAAVTGLYKLPMSSFKVIKNLKPSARGEYEIADVINHYMQDDNMQVHRADSHGLHWFDCGNFDDILDCASLIQSLEHRTGVLFGDFVAELTRARRDKINFNYVSEYLESIKSVDYINKFKRRINLK